MRKHSSACRKGPDPPSEHMQNAQEDSEPYSAVSSISLANTYMRPESWRWQQWVNSGSSMEPCFPLRREAMVPNPSAPRGNVALN